MMGFGLTSYETDNLVTRESVRQELHVTRVQHHDVESAVRQKGEAGQTTLQSVARVDDLCSGFASSLVWISCRSWRGCTDSPSRAWTSCVIAWRCTSAVTVPLWMIS